MFSRPKVRCSRPRPFDPLAVVACWALAGAALLPRSLTGQEQTLAIVGGTIINGTDAPPLADGSILVRRGRIVGIGTRSQISVPAGARVVDARGQYIIPGLIDMHSHLAIGTWEPDTVGGRRGGLRYAYDDAAARALAAAQWRFGITTIRNPAGPTAEAVALRTRIRTGAIAGPRVFTAGAPIDAMAQGNAQVAATTDSAVAAAVEQQAQSGVDIIKLYAGLRPPLVRAGVEAAHRLGLRVILHAWLTSWTDAARAGVDALTHISPGSADLLPQDKRDEFRRSLRGTQFLFDWFQYMDPESAEIREMIGALRAHAVSVDPTLVAFEQMAWADQPDHFPADAYALVPPSLRSKPAPERVLTTGWTSADFAKARTMWPRMLAFTRQLHDAGVMLTVGTDGANPWYLHREMELLVAAGIPADEVLRMATRNAARALGMGSELGTLEPGKVADMVILQRNPIEHIRNTRTVTMTIQGGVPRRVP